MQKMERVSIVFEVKADASHPAVALASMLSKYVREVLMRMFNDFWRRQQPGLAATGGYYTDGLRFLQEIEPLRQRLGIDREMMVRCR